MYTLKSRYRGIQNPLKCLKFRRVYSFNVIRNIDKFNGPLKNNVATDDRLLFCVQAL